jgi:hypothetical protein
MSINMSRIPAAETTYLQRSSAVAIKNYLLQMASAAGNFYISRPN